MLRVALLLCLVSLSISGCATKGNSELNDSTPLPQPPAAHYQLRLDDIRKVVITLGDGTVTKDETIKVPYKINVLEKPILDWIVELEAD